MKENSTRYDEVRFRSGYAVRQIPEQEDKLIKIEKIPNINKLPTANNNGRWLQKVIMKTDTPRPELTFKHRLTDIVTNSLPMNAQTASLAQYKLTIHDVEQKCDLKDDDPLKLDLFKQSKRKLRGLYPSFFDKMHVFSHSPNAPPKVDPFQITRNNKAFQISLELQSKWTAESQRQRMKEQSASTNTNTNDTNNVDNDNKKNEFGRVSYHEFYGIVDQTFREQGLNIVHRERFTQSGYNKLYRRDDVYYNLKDERQFEVYPQRGDLRYPDCYILEGFKSTAHYAVNEQVLIKTNLEYKLVTQLNVYEMIERFGMDHTKQFVTGKNAVTIYGPSSDPKVTVRDQMIKIADLDQNLSLQNGFERNGETITFWDYFTKEKGLKMTEEEEKAMVVDRVPRWENGQKVHSENHYPPQKVHVLLANEDISDDTKAMRREKSHVDVDRVIRRGTEMNKRLNEVLRMRYRGKRQFETIIEPVTVTGYYLNSPSISITGILMIFVNFKILNFPTFDWLLNGNLMTVPIQSGDRGVNIPKDVLSYRNEKGFGGRDWSNVRDFGYYGNDRAGMKWMILYDEQHGNYNANAVRDQYDFYVGTKRRFRNPPLRPPDVIRVDYGDLQSIRQIVRSSDCRIFLFIISSDEQGSKTKIDISRHILFEREPTNAIGTHFRSDTDSDSKSNDQSNQQNKRIELNLQFILDSACSNNNALFGTFDSLFLKSGLCLYRMDPNLPSNTFQWDRNLWILGITVTGNISNVNYAVISCNRRPFEGQLRFVRNYWYPLPSHCDVIPQNLMRRFMAKILDYGLREALREKDSEIPMNIIVLRSHGGDSLFEIIVSKELAGIKREIIDFGKRHNNELRKVLGIKVGADTKWKWTPAVMFTVVQENVPDVFAMQQQDRFEMVREPILVNDGVTSYQWMDVMLSNTVKQEKFYQKVLRLVTLCDDYYDEHYVDENGKPVKGGKRIDNALRNNAALQSDYYQLIFAQFWMCARQIPFAKKPQLPGPLSYAYKAAIWIREMTTEHDTDISALRIDVESHHPKLLVIEDRNMNDESGKESGM